MADMYFFHGLTAKYQIKEKYQLLREDFELEKEVHEKVIQKFERMVELTDDYSEIDLQVILSKSEKFKLKTTG